MGITCDSTLLSLSTWSNSGWPADCIGSCLSVVQTRDRRTYRPRSSFVTLQLLSAGRYRIRWTLDGTVVVVLFFFFLFNWFKRERKQMLYRMESSCLLLVRRIISIRIQSEGRTLNVWVVFVSVCCCCCHVLTGMFFWGVGGGNKMLGVGRWMSLVGAWPFFYFRSLSPNHLPLLMSNERLAASPRPSPRDIRKRANRQLCCSSFICNFSSRKRAKEPLLSLSTPLSIVSVSDRCHFFFVYLRPQELSFFVGRPSPWIPIQNVFHHQKSRQKWSRLGFSFSFSLLLSVDA